MLNANREGFIPSRSGQDDNSTVKYDTDAEMPAGMTLPPLAEVARSLAAALDTAEVMQRISESAVELTRARGAYVEQVIAPDGTVEVVASRGRGVPPVGMRVPYPGSLTEEIMSAGAPTLVAQTSQVGQALAPYLAEQCDRCAALVVPLLSSGDVLGTLVLLGETQARFGEREIARARILGDLASVSLRRVLLLEEAQQRRRQAEESEARFRALAENATEAIVTVDTEDRIHFVNPAAERIFGYTVEEMLTLPFSAMVPERMREQHRQGIQRYTATQERHIPWNGIELPGLTKDGHEVLLEVTFSEYRQGERQFFNGIMRDITDRKRAEAELADRARTSALGADVGAAVIEGGSLAETLRRSAAAVKHHLDAAFARIWTWNEAEQLLELQTSAGEDTRRDPSQNRVALGQGKIGKIGKERAPYLTNDVQSDPLISDKDWARREGMEAFAGYPLVVDDRLMGVMAVFARHTLAQPDLEALRSVSDRLALAIAHYRGEQERIRLLESERQARTELERVTESRVRMMRGFSHDVKNPLGAADGHAQLLEDGILGELEPKQQQSVRRIRASIRSALDLINDLVELARAEAGQIEIEAAPTDVRAVTRELAAEYQAQAEAEGLQLGSEFPDPIPTITSDPRRVRQVLGNLLSNAIKYNRPGGHITLRAAPRIRDAHGSTPCVAVDVQDSGTGIPEEKLHLLFREFSRLDPEAREGAGLGLAISQRIARALGGEITVQSTVHVGSTFTLWLPLVTEAAPAEPAAAPHAGA